MWPEIGPKFLFAAKSPVRIISGSVSKETNLPLSDKIVWSEDRRFCWARSNVGMSVAFVYGSRSRRKCVLYGFGDLP